MKLTLTIVEFMLCLHAADAGLRQTAGRVRNVDAAGWSTVQDTAGSTALIDALKREEEHLEEEEASILELVEAMEAFNSGMSMGPTVAPTVSTAPSASPSVSVQPSQAPTVAFNWSFFPTTSPTILVTDSPSVSSAPSDSPTSSPTISAAPSTSPTLSECLITPEERRAGILGILDQVADSSLIRDVSTPQGRATEWIISQDARRLCPDEIKIVQRWVLAVMYFSTGGDSWIQCFDGDLECGDFLPFVNDEAFLSSSIECEWAGISCNTDACVTEIEFEENNLVGTIPSELGLLNELVIWGMERGNLTGTIPSEMGQLEKLIFIDLDFNQLTGTLPESLYNLVNLTQLDLNNNFLSGDVAGIGVFSELEFLQLHANSFSGTIPDAVGSFTRLSTFTLHETNFTGSIPPGLCDLVDNGTLTSLIADCGGDTPEITCECCTDCRFVEDPTGV